MPLALRTIRQSRWLDQNFPWLEEDDAPADPLGDLVTKDSELSIWIIDDEETRLNRFVVAHAATRDLLAHVDIALFDYQVLIESDFEISDKEKGTTQDSEVNEWHRDLVRLSGLKLVRLSQVIMRNAEIRRISEITVRELIIEGVNLGWINITKLKPKLKSKIEPLI